MAGKSAAKSAPEGGAGKRPRTARGERTRAKLIEAAAAEFGERGFADASISGITSRAGTALGTFYTYFESKDEIFRSLVRDLSDQVRQRAAAAVTPEMGALETEKNALAAFLDFAREHKEVYRIIDEAEFVDPASYRAHYERTAQRLGERLQKGAADGELREGLGEVHAWALMGMNVFLGLRYSLWGQDLSVEEVAKTANEMLREGIARRD